MLQNNKWASKNVHNRIVIFTIKNQTNFQWSLQVETGTPNSSYHRITSRYRLHHRIGLRDTLYLNYRTEQIHWLTCMCVLNSLQQQSDQLIYLSLFPVKIVTVKHVETNQWVRSKTKSQTLWPQCIRYIPKL